MNKFYPGEPVKKHIQSLNIIIQDIFLLLTPKYGKGKLTVFRVIGERVITIYAEEGGISRMFNDVKTQGYLFGFLVKYDNDS